MKLDLGCGQSPKPGFLGVDIVDGPNVAITANLFTPQWDVREILAGSPASQLNVCRPAEIHNGIGSGGWVLKDDTVDELFSSHLVEHVPDLVAFMHEAYRVLKPGGRFIVQHPYQHSNRAWQDPTHVRALNEVSWSYYDANWRKSIGIDHYDGFSCNFEVVSVQKLLAPGIEAKLNFNQKKIAEAIKHWVNVVDDLIVVLRSRKESDG